jgi:hypothetical protein
LPIVPPIDQCLDVDSYKIRAPDLLESTTEYGRTSSTTIGTPVAADRRESADGAS